jgi:hypothetical protein
MMSRNSYYCLVAGLTELFVDQKKAPYPQVDFKDLLADSLYQKDFDLACLIYLRYDIQNVLNLLQKKDKPFDERGVFNKEEIDEIISTKEIGLLNEMPGSFYEFILNITICFKNEITLYPGFDWENQFTTYYYDFAMTFNNEFIHEWFMFEKTLHNVAAGINARNHNKKTDKEIIGAGEADEDMRNAKSKDFGLSREYDFVDRLLDGFENKNLLEREKDIDLVKWEELNELTLFHYFSVEKVLTYIIKLGILERWDKLDKEAGQEMFNRLINELTSSYKFSKEFDVNG